MKKLLLISCFLVLFPNCQSCNDNCYYNYYANVTDYKVDAETKTPVLAIPVMTNGFDVDLTKIDEIIFSVENCLSVKLKRECLEDVIPPDWYISYCVNPEGEELFPCRVDPQVCADKGLPIDPDCVPGQLPDEDCPCPCNCRATIQDENIIITTPNLKLFSAELIRMMTGVNNIWEDPELTKCYTDPEAELAPLVRYGAGPAADNAKYQEGMDYCDGMSYCE
jgi:hypothetical protein